MNDENKKLRHRSPAYPAVGLKGALDILRKFYNAQKRAAVHLDAAYESLGYEKGSSSGARVIAALIAFGLMIDEGSGLLRKVKISEAGYRILILDETDGKWKQEVRVAALKPKLYSDLVNHWPSGLPSDSAIRQHLLLELKFNENSVKDVISGFRSTYDFALLGSSDEALDADGDPSDEEQQETESAPVDFKVGHSTSTLLRSEVLVEDLITHTVPLPGDRQAFLQVPKGMTSKQFEFLKKWVALYEDVLSDKGEGS